MNISRKDPSNKKCLTFLSISRHVMLKTNSGKACNKFLVNVNVHH